MKQQEDQELELEKTPSRSRCLFEVTACKLSYSCIEVCSCLNEIRRANFSLCFLFFFLVRKISRNYPRIYHSLYSSVQHIVNKWRGATLQVSACPVFFVMVDHMQRRRNKWADYGNCFQHNNTISERFDKIVQFYYVILKNTIFTEYYYFKVQQDSC